MIRSIVAVKTNQLLHHWRKWTVQWMNWKWKRRLIGRSDEWPDTDWQPARIEFHSEVIFYMLGVLRRKADSMTITGCNLWEMGFRGESCTRYIGHINARTISQRKRETNRWMEEYSEHDFD